MANVQIIASIVKIRTVALFSLCCVGLMLTMPLFDWRSDQPLPAFYREWDTFLLSLGALTLLLMSKSWEQQILPRITLLPTGLIVIVFLQLLLAGKLSYPCQALSYSLYLIWALMLMVLGGQLRRSLGLATVVTALSWALLAGSEISALIAVIQHYGWQDDFAPLIFQTDHSITTGNTAQHSHLVLYVLMGIVSLGLLQARGFLKLWQAGLLAIPILWFISIAISPGSWLGLKGYHAYLFHWQVAWQTFLDFPMIGAGFGQMSWQHFLLAPELQSPGAGELSNNVHNLILQLAAESGVAGLSVVGASMAYWLLGQRGEQGSPHRNYCFTILGLLLICSMLDSPYRHACFLSIAALLLGVLDTGRIRFNLKRSGGLLMTCMLMLSLLVLIRVSSAYSDLASLYNPQSDTISQQARDEKVIQILNRLDEENILGHYGQVYAASVPDFSIDNAEWRLMMSQKAAYAVPERSLVYRLAVLQAATGKLDEAKATMKRAIWAYPDHYDKVVAHALPWLMLQAPQLKPLYAFARQAYTERMRFMEKK